MIMTSAADAAVVPAAASASATAAAFLRIQCAMMSRTFSTPMLGEGRFRGLEECVVEEDDAAAVAAPAVSACCCWLRGLPLLWIYR